MSDSAYITDSVYQSLARPDQTPIQLSYVAAMAGFAPPDPAREFTYMDLGCSTGETINLLAAAYPRARFLGVDLNPAAIAKGQRDAAAASLGNVSFSVDAFSELVNSEHGQFDYITCQGTYSWLDPIQKQALFDGVDRHLKPDGIFLVHYVPFGNAQVTTMWHALRQMTPADGRDSAERMADGVRLLKQLKKLGAVYFRNSPQAAEILKDVAEFATDSVEFTNVSHNALAEHYRTAFFDEVEGACTELGLSYCGDMDLRMNDPDQCVPSAIRHLYEGFATASQRETFKDFSLPRAGRADVFVRSQIGNEPAVSSFLQRSLSATFTEPANMVSTSIRDLAKNNFFDFDRPAIHEAFRRIERGEASLRAVARTNEAPRNELDDAFHKLLTCLKIRLYMPEHLVPIPDGPHGWAPASKYNANALENALSSTGPVSLAAPALGGSVSLARPGALIALDAWRNGAAGEVMDAYKRILQDLDGTGLNDMKNLPDMFANKKSFAEFRAWFVSQRLPILGKLGAMKVVQNSD